MPRSTIAAFAIATTLLAAFFGCTSSSTTYSGGDTDFEFEQAESDPWPEIDCEVYRSESAADISTPCSAWCNKVISCGGAVDPEEACLRACNAKSHEWQTDVFSFTGSCIVNTSCAMFEQAREQGDLSSNLEVYCRKKAVAENPSDLEREDVCDDLYQRLVDCYTDTAESNRAACVGNISKVLKDEAFANYARCAEEACDGRVWQDCLDQAVCVLGRDE